MIALSVIALLYFLPTILAVRRGHDVTLILLLNLFFGWTVIGWFAMLLWAALSAPPYGYDYYAYPPPPPPPHTTTTHQTTGVANRLSLTTDN